MLPLVNVTFFVTPQLWVVSELKQKFVLCGDNCNLYFSKYVVGVTIVVPDISDFDSVLSLETVGLVEVLSVLLGTKFTSELVSDITLSEDICIYYLYYCNDKFIGIDEDGKIIVNLTGINSLSGMSLESVSFNTDSINLEVSRIYDGKLILSSNFGDTTGSPLCNSKDSKDLLVVGNYELSYKGNKEMNELVLISGSSISEYVKANNLC